MELMQSLNGTSTPTKLHCCEFLGLRAFRVPTVVEPKKVAASYGYGNSVVILSVKAFQPVRRPCLPQVGLLSKPTTLITDRVICTDVIPGAKVEFRYAKFPAKGFIDFIDSTPKSEIIAFFRDVITEIESYRQLKDYHLKIRNGEGDFRIEVHFGGNRYGPEEWLDQQCIACYTDSNLFPLQGSGMQAGQCILKEFSDQPHVLCRLDHKGRSGFLITPVRHVERISDLEDEELFTFWNVAVRALRTAGVPFISMIVNHGSYRTIDHLVLKIWVDNVLFQQYRSLWTEEKKELWNHLQLLAKNRPKKQRVCFFFRRNNSCRHGEFCSYLHV